MAEAVCARNAVQALTRVELFGAGHGTRQPGCARDALLHTHVAAAPLVATLAQQLRREQYRRACTTLEQLVALVCSDDADAVDAFVRAGGVPELWRVLTLDPAELAAHYRAEAPNAARDASANEFFNLIMRLVGNNASFRFPRPSESDYEDESGDGGERGDESGSVNAEEQQEQQQQQQQQQQQRGEPDGVVGDPALEPFGAEDGDNAEEEEEEDLYVPNGGTGEGITSMAQIAATMINQPRHSEWLLTALRKQSVLLLRESAFVVETVSKETVRSQQCMAAILRFLDDKSTFFQTVPLLEELSSQNIAGCNLAQQGLCSNLPPLSPHLNSSQWLCGTGVHRCLCRARKRVSTVSGPLLFSIHRKHVL